MSSSDSTSETESASASLHSGTSDTPAPPSGSQFLGAPFLGAPTHPTEPTTQALADDDSDSESSSRRRPIREGNRRRQAEAVGGDTQETRQDGLVDEQTLAPGPVAHPSYELPPTNVPEETSTAETVNRPSTTPQVDPAPAQSSTNEDQGLTLQEALDETTEALGDLSTEDGPSSRPGAQRAAETSAPPTTSPPSSSQALTRRAPDIILPRWQPDAEATICPICHTQFSIFVRKHHCRKCGRVVCSACSPHRITIPHQYNERYGLLGAEGGIADFNAIGGGERVRLCNPCVPDPNTTPPRNDAPVVADGSTSWQHRQAIDNFSRYFPGTPPPETFRNRSATTNSGLGSVRLPGFSVPGASGTNPILGGTPPGYYYRSPLSAQHGQALPPQNTHTARGLTLWEALGAPDARTRGTGGLPSSRNAVLHPNHAQERRNALASSSRSGRPLPRTPQIAEEDECPVCHRELPSRTLANFETLRENHINSCIAAHSSSFAGPSSRPGGGQPGGQHGTPPPRPIRYTGVFPYLATEKDCVDSAECTICFEEYEVGVPMARLECLCRFHRACIDSWFVNHPGRCPVHQHDSYGY
ncbi:FYVE-domain-containing protein [Xylariomycetidae sp. FL0641]|nr:FYVE-domain-containing protein [Xylariomycetidae sp. FL0641]